MDNGTVASAIGNDGNLNPNVKLLGVSFDNHLYDVDVQTGLASNPRYTYGALIDIAQAPDGALYGITVIQGTIDKFNLTTGEVNSVARTNTLPITEGDLDFDPMTGVIYGVLKQTVFPTLFSINTTTGQTTEVTTIGNEVRDISGLAFDPRGNLYALDTKNDQLLQINKLSGEVIHSISVMTPTGTPVNLGSTAGMDFNPLTGELFVADGDAVNGFGTNALYTLNITNGVLNFIGDLGLSKGLSGLEFVWTGVHIPFLRRNDFNGDGKSDILWRNSNGSVAAWLMDGTSLVSGGYLSTPLVDNNWSISGTGDFNGDGKSDILWRNSNGSVAAWLMDGTSLVSGGYLSTPVVDNNWTISGTGDFNGDGKSDILWHNSNGSVAAWLMDGTSLVSGGYLSTPVVDNNWTISGTGDFNGDGKSDILWRNSNGSVAAWLMDGTSLVSGGYLNTPVVDNSWTISGTGDFNGDGKSDILWRNSNGSVAAWLMDGTSLVSGGYLSTSVVDNSWTISGTGDFNGDGKSDILWRNNDGSVAAWLMNGTDILSAGLVGSADNTWQIATSTI